MDGGSEASEDGRGERGAIYDNPVFPVNPEARRVELVDADDVVESSGNSTTFHV